MKDMIYNCRTDLKMSLIVVKCFKPSQFPLLPEVTIKNEFNQVVARKVPDESLFARAGVVDGDIIVSVNDTSLENKESSEVFKLLSTLQGDLKVVFKRHKFIPGPPIEASNHDVLQEKIEKSIPPGPPIITKSKVANAEEHVKTKKRRVSFSPESFLQAMNSQEPLKTLSEDQANESELKKENQTLKDTIAVHTLTIHDYEKQLNEKQKIIEQWALDCHNLEVENVKKVDHIAESEVKISNLEKKLKSLEDESSKHKELVEKVFKLQDELALMDEIKRSSEENIKTLEEKLNVAESKVKEVVQTFDDQNEKIRKLEKELNEFGDRKKRLKRKISSFEKLLRKATSEKDSSDKRSKELESELMEKENKIHEQEICISNLEEEKKSFKDDSKYKEMSSTIEKLEKEIDEKCKLNDSLKHEIEELNKKIADTAADNILTNQIEVEITKNLEEENKSLVERINKQHARETDLKMRIHELTSKNKTLKQRINKFDDFAEEITLALRLKRRERSTENNQDPRKGIHHKASSNIDINRSEKHSRRSNFQMHSKQRKSEAKDASKVFTYESISPSPSCDNNLDASTSKRRKNGE